MQIHCHTEFKIQRPDGAATRDAFGSRQVQWTNIQRFGDLIDLSGRDYEFANVYSTSEVQSKLRTYSDEVTRTLNSKDNILIGTTLYEVSHVRRVGIDAFTTELIDIYISAKQ